MCCVGKIEKTLFNVTVNPGWNNTGHEPFMMESPCEGCIGNI